MRAAHSLDGDLALAVGAHLGGGLLRCGGLFGLFVQGVDKLDHNKQYKGHDEEVDDGVDELTDLDAGAAQTNDHIGKICLEEQADQRVDDVLHQRGDDGGEGTADDTAMSSTLPRMANALNSSRNFLMPLFFSSIDNCSFLSPFSPQGVLLFL